MEAAPKSAIRLQGGSKLLNGACCCAQAQCIGGAPARYSGMLDVFRKTVAGEGVRGLYKGILPDMLKIAPAAGISWCARRGELSVVEPSSVFLVPAL